MAAVANTAAVAKSEEPFYYDYATIALLDNPGVTAAMVVATIATAVIAGNETTKYVAAFQSINLSGSAKTTSQLAYRGGGPKHEGGGGAAGLKLIKYNTTYSVGAITTVLAIAYFGWKLWANHGRYTAMATAIGKIKNGDRKPDDLNEFTEADQAIIRAAL